MAQDEQTGHDALRRSLLGVVQNLAFLGYTRRTKTVGLWRPNFGGKDVGLI